MLPACFLLGGQLQAQEPGQPPKGKSTRVALVAVGDPPNPGFDIKGGRRVLKETAEAEYPPTLLYVPKANGKDQAPGGGKNKPDPIMLGLNLPGQQLEIHGTDTLRLMEMVKTDDQTSYKEWTAIKLPVTQEDLTAMLYRSKPGASWRNSPKSLVLSNGLAAFPPHSVRVINLSTKVMVFQLDGAKPFAVNPTHFKVLPATNPEFCSYTVAFRNKGNELEFIAQSQAATMQGDSRVNLVAYDTDSSAPSDQVPVRLQSFYELPPPPPKPAKPTANGTPGDAAESS